MTAERFLSIHDPEFRARGERVLGARFSAKSERVRQVTQPTSRLNVLPFDDEAGKAVLPSRSWAGPSPRGRRSTRPSPPTTGCAWTWPTASS